MSLLGPAIISGLILAALYGLLAAGIVIAYNTSRVINFAQGALAATAVFVLNTVLGTHAPYAVALLAGMAAGAVLGYAMARTTLIPLRHASTLHRTIATIGWLILLQGAVALVFNGDQSTNISPMFSNQQLLSLFGLGISSQEVAIVLTCIAVGAALAVLFTRTRVGLAMRATSENPAAAELLGIDANVMVAAAYAIAGALAALAGILVAPELGAIDVTTLTLFVIQSLAAALLGGMRSLFRTAVGAIALGVTQSVVSITPLAGKVPGLKFSIAFAFIVIALVLRPDLARHAVEVAQSRARVRLPRIFATVPARAAAAALVAVICLAEGLLGAGGNGVFGDFNRFRWAEVFADAVIFLSLTVLVGFIGQISLCQISFAGFGAFFAAIFTTSWHIPVFFALPLAALCTAPIGALVGLPALRIRGLQLAVVTLAFALVCDQLLFAQSLPLSGGPSGRAINAVVGPVNFLADSTNRQMYWAFLVVLALTSASVWLFSRSPSGRAFAAVRDSEVAAAASGVSVARMKITAFSLAAAIAGLGGGMFALTLGTVSSPAFNPGFSIQYLALALLAGVGSVAGAFVAATFLVWGPVVTAASLAHVGIASSLAPNATVFLSGLFLILILRVDSHGLVGVVHTITARTLALRPWRALAHRPAVHTRAP